jgi:hypothetical protein
MPLYGFYQHLEPLSTQRISRQFYWMIRDSTKTAPLVEKVFLKPPHTALKVMKEIFSSVMTARTK